MSVRLSVKDNSGMVIDLFERRVTIQLYYLSYSKNHHFQIPPLQRNSSGKFTYFGEQIWPVAKVDFILSKAFIRQIFILKVFLKMLQLHTHLSI